MAVQVYFAKTAKRRNSTLQATFSTGYNCLLKDACSIDNPTFILSYVDSNVPIFPYTLAKWDDRYYFVTEVRSMANNIWEVSCIIDVLATYKSDILSMTPFVAYAASYAYSNVTVADPRRPLKAEGNVYTYADVPSFIGSGFFVVSVLGKTGCKQYAFDKNKIDVMLQNISSWSSNGAYDILNNDASGTPYNWSTTEGALRALADISTQTGFMGNAYSNAPSCLRSCIWVPFNKALFASGADQSVYLGEFDTGVGAPEISDIAPVVFDELLPIAWGGGAGDPLNARTTQIMLYLPYVGNVDIPVDPIIGETSLYIKASACACDGSVAYEVYAATSGLILGTYSGNAASNYAIGINQQSSLGSVVTTAYTGAKETVNCLVQSNLSPISIAGAIGGAAITGLEATYKTADVAMSRNPTTIGSFTGASGSGLDQLYKLSTIIHHPVGDYTWKDQMGYPVQKVTSLSTFTGYVQCSNAHVSAAAQAQELDAIDSYLNSGFYIE